MTSFTHHSLRPLKSTYFSTLRLTASNLGNSENIITAIELRTSIERLRLMRLATYVILFIRQITIYPKEFHDRKQVLSTKLLAKSSYIGYKRTYKITY